MKKVLLMLFCVLLSIGAGWPAGQQPERRLLVRQTNQETPSQIIHQHPVKQGQTLKWQKANSNTKTIAPAKATKAASRVNETAEVSLPTFDSAEAATTMMQENADFTVITTLYNESETDFEDEIRAVLLTGDSFWGFDIVYETDPVPVSVAKGSSQKVSIPGHINSSEVPAGTYYLGIGATAGYLCLNDDPEANIFPIQVLPDPATNFILSMTAKTMIPETLNQNEDGILPVTITNTGGIGFNGPISMTLTDKNGNMVYYTDFVEASIAANASEEVQIPYHLPSIIVDAGTYTLNIAWVDEEEGWMYNIPLADGSYDVEIKVLEKEGPVLVVEENQTIYPETVTQDVEFTLPATITNTGVDFNGEIGIVMYDPSYGNAIWANEFQEADIARDASKKLSLMGTVSADIPVGQYFLSIAYIAGGYYIPIGEGSIVTIEVNPETTPVLSWAATEVPSAIMQSADFAVKGTISNTGADFTGQMEAILVEESIFGTMVVYESGAQEVSVPRDGHFNFTATGNVGALVDGWYTLYIAYLEGDDFYPISEGYDVEVTLNPETSPMLSIVEEESTLPTSIVQGTEFTTKVMVKNEGMAFSGEIYIQIADGNSIAFTSAPQAVTIANGENKLLTFTETVTGIEPDDDYYFDVVAENESGYFRYIHTITGMEVGADPTAPALSIAETDELNSGTYVTFYQGWENPFNATIRNTGGGNYEGTLALAISDDWGREILLYGEPVDADIPAGEAKTFDFTIQVNELEAGYYKLSICNDEGECLRIGDTAWDTFMLEVKEAEDNPSAISGTKADATFTVEPNPATSYVDVACSEGIQSVRIYSLSGSLLMQEEAEGTTCRLNVSALPQGAYLMAIITHGNAKKTKRFIKE